MVSSHIHSGPSWGGIWEVFVKSLVVGIFVLLINLGCGGYGSGMGMTAAPVPAFAPASGTYSTPLTVSNSGQHAGRHHLCRRRWFHAVTVFASVSRALCHYAIGEGAGDRHSQRIFHQPGSCRQLHSAMRLLDS